MKTEKEKPKETGAKYKDIEFAIETQHGCYPIGDWCYVVARETKAEAIAECKRLGDEYRVVDAQGVIIFPLTIPEPGTITLEQWKTFRNKFIRGYNDPRRARPL